MKWPVMLRRTHTREYVKQGESYRWQLEAAERKTREAEHEARNLAAKFVRAHVPFSQYDRDSKVFPIEVSGHMISHYVRGEGTAKLARIIGDQVAIELLGLSRDHRPDLRNPTQL